jgi:hypothetical protein
MSYEPRLSWDRAEELLPGMTAELDAFYIAHFQPTFRSLAKALATRLDRAVKGKRRDGAPLTRAQEAFDDFVEDVHERLRPQMLEKPEERCGTGSRQLRIPSSLLQCISLSIIAACIVPLT